MKSLNIKQQVLNKSKVFFFLI